MLAIGRKSLSLALVVVGGCYNGADGDENPFSSMGADGADSAGTDGSGAEGTAGDSSSPGSGTQGDSDGDDSPDTGGDPDGPGGTPGAGLLDCPTVAAPAYAAAQIPAADGPSLAFSSTCAGCHGANGEGAPDVPPLPGGLTAELYAQTVRAGKHTDPELGNRKMPAFDASFISDEALAHDYAWLIGENPPPLDEVAARKDSADWTEAEVDEAFQRGLSAFREPDSHGAGCANCHAPDGLDLAVLGFDDPTLMRRALQHISPELSRDVVDLIHAQRIRHSITSPCDPMQWRPFQPGGMPLEPAEDVLSSGEGERTAQDVAFGRYLQDENLAVAVGVIDSAEAARAAANGMIEKPLRSTRLGLELPRWTSDHHHGDGFGSINDWIPELPSIPNNPSQWYALHDAYIENPTYANMEAIRHNTSEMTNQGDEYKGVTQWGNDWVDGEMGLKMSSLLVGQHMFRIELLGHEKGWHERGPTALEGVPGEYASPVFYTAQNALNVGCGNDEDCHLNYASQLTPNILQELGPDEDIRDLLGQINHPWFSLGQLFDQGLLESGGFGHNTTQAVYWQQRFGHNGHEIHKTYFNAHRVLVQTMWPTEMGDTGMVPYHRGSGEKPDFPLFLHGEWMRVRLGSAGPDDPRFESTVRLNINTINMFAYLMKEALQNGAATDEQEYLHTMLDEWTDTAEYYMEIRDDIASVASLAPDIEYISGPTTRDLLNELHGLIDAAPQGDYADP